MQVWVSKPLGCSIGGLAPRLEELWKTACAQAGAELHLTQPEKFETHGAYLKRLWETEIADHADDVHVISELDFMPYRGGLEKFQKLVEAGKAPGAALPLYVWRSYEKDQATDLCPGKVTGFECRGVPAAGPYFMFFNFKAWRTRLLSGDFLNAAGPQNDAANDAIGALLEAQALSPNAFSTIPHKDAWPCVHGYTYPGIGLHLMYARDMDQPADTVIGWPDCKKPLTAGTHLANCRRVMR